MGIVSTRQGIYLAIGGGLIYSYIIPAFKFLYPIFGIIATVIICMVLAMPVAAVVVYFAFLRSRSTTCLEINF